MYKKYEEAIRLHDFVLEAEDNEERVRRLDAVMRFTVDNFFPKSAIRDWQKDITVQVDPVEGKASCEMFMNMDVLAQYRDIPPTLLEAVFPIAVIRDLVLIGRKNFSSLNWSKLTAWPDWHAKFANLILYTAQ